MQLKRVLVTGGAGLIGSHLVDQLLAQPVNEVVVLDNFVRGRMQNLAAATADPRLTIVRGDIRDRALLGEVTAGIDVVFHQAALRITQCAEAPRLAMAVLIDGTYNVLEAAAAAGVRKVVAASSAAVYGLATQFPTPEDHHPYDNRTLYGAAKAFNEMLLRSQGLPYVALRYFNVYGPRMDIHGAYTEVLIRWMERIRAGRPPLILGDGRQTLDFVYAEDVARANLLAAQSDVTGEVFNVASGVETRLNDLAHTLLRVMGRPALPLEYGPERQVNAVPRRWADVSKARRHLGFEASVPLDEGLRRLAAWWQAERVREDNGHGAPAHTADQTLGG